MVSNFIGTTNTTILVHILENMLFAASAWKLRFHEITPFNLKLLTPDRKRTLRRKSSKRKDLLTVLNHPSPHVFYGRIRILYTYCHVFGFKYIYKSIKIYQPVNLVVSDYHKWQCYINRENYRSLIDYVTIPIKDGKLWNRENNLLKSRIILNFGMVRRFWFY